MNKTLVITLAVIGGILLGAFILSAGFFLGRSAFNPGDTGATGMMGNGFRDSRQFRDGLRHDGWKSIWQPCLRHPDHHRASQTGVEGYLNRLNNPDLVLSEIMVFDKNAYARITKKSTGTGAMELLVDPASLTVFPEQGPNMMWNLKMGQ